MNIDWLISCRFVEVHDNLGTIVGAGIDTFWLRELPGAIQIMLAIRLVGLPEEFTSEQRHPMATRIKAPNGDTLSEAKGEFAVEAEGARPGYLAGVTIPTAVRFDVRDEGTYAIECEFGDAWKSLPIHVVHGLPPGLTPET